MDKSLIIKLVRKETHQSLLQLVVPQAVAPQAVVLQSLLQVVQSLLQVVV
jgi:hypothetical protein